MHFADAGSRVRPLLAALVSHEAVRLRDAAFWTRTPDVRACYHVPVAKDIAVQRDALRIASWHQPDFARSDMTLSGADPLCTSTQ
jgi:hypothetical protein